MTARDSQWACSFCGALTDFSTNGGAVRVPCSGIPPQSYAGATVRDGILTFCQPCRAQTNAGRALTALHAQDATQEA